MKIKVDHDFGPLKYTVSDIAKQKYIGCIVSNDKRLHLIDMGDSRNYHWLHVESVWDTTPKKKAECIIQQCEHGSEFHIFDTKQELLDWKAAP